MVEWTVDRSEAGGRLDKFVKSRLKEAPDSFIYKMARKKNLVLNDLRCTGKELLKAGDCIKLYVSDETIALFSSEKSTASEVSMYTNAFKKLKGIQVIEEYTDLLFLYQSAGILSQKAKDTDLSVNEWLIGYLLSKKEITEESLQIFHPSVLNRLDRNTSGIVICGKTPFGSRFGSALLKDRTLHKYYHCIVYGECRLSGTYKGYLYKDKSDNLVTFYSDEGKIPGNKVAEAKPVSLSVKPLKEADHKTLLEIELHTGKSHQIRVMLQSIGFPIVGDPKYKNISAKSNRQDSTENHIKPDNKVNTKNQPSGQMLCAVRLEFPEITGDMAYLSKRIISCKAPFSLN